PSDSAAVVLSRLRPFASTAFHTPENNYIFCWTFFPLLFTFLLGKTGKVRRQMQEIDFSGSRFSFIDLDLILGVTKDFPTLSLTELSKTLCELLEWKRPNGKLKYEECRALLEKLQADNLISLPALHKIRCSPRRVQVTEKGNTQGAITGTS